MYFNNFAYLPSITFSGLLVIVLPNSGCEFFGVISSLGNESFNVVILTSATLSKWNNSSQTTILFKAKSWKFENVSEIFSLPPML